MEIKIPSVWFHTSSLQTQLKPLADSIKVQTEWLHSYDGLKPLTSSLQTQLKPLTDSIKAQAEWLQSCWPRTEFPAFNVKSFFFLNSLKFVYAKFLEFYRTFETLSYNLYLEQITKEKTRETLWAFYQEQYKLLLWKYQGKLKDEDELRNVLVDTIERVCNRNPLMVKVLTGEIALSVVLYDQEQVRKILWPYWNTAINNYIISNYQRKKPDPLLDGCILIDPQIEYQGPEERNQLSLDSLSLQSYCPRPHKEGFLEMLLEESPFLYLHTIGKYTYEEITRLMEVSDSTVKRRLRKEGEKFAHKWKTHNKLRKILKRLT